MELSVVALGTAISWSILTLFMGKRRKSSQEPWRLTRTHLSSGQQRLRHQNKARLFPSCNNVWRQRWEHKERKDHMLFSLILSIQVANQPLSRQFSLRWCLQWLSNSYPWCHIGSMNLGARQKWVTLPFSTPAVQHLNSLAAWSWRSWAA